MAEEPEQVLEQVGAASRGAWKNEVCAVRSKPHHQEDGRQDGRREHHQARGRERAPAEDGQPPPGQPGRPHRHDRRDQVEPEERHRDPDEDEEDDVGVHPHVRLVVERPVAGPAGGKAAEEDGAGEDRPGRHQQPEGERLDPREGHPLRADHQGDEVVGERAEDARAS